MTYSDYRVAVVTGATSGIGRGAIDLFLERGLTVHAVARDESRLAELAARGVVVHAIDVRDTAAIERELAGIEADIVLNSAGVSRPGNILDSSAEDLDDILEVNLGAVMQILRVLFPGMVARDRGHVINISSMAGLYNFFGHTAYHATKAAVHQLSRQLRNDALGRRVRVTEVSPGRIETEIFSRNMGGTPETDAAAWATYYEGYESLTVADVVAAIDFAVAAPSHVNVGLFELLPTFQVPGGLTFNRRDENAE
ncbi:SDR family oxidoreductase [Microbacterium sp. ZXX196]|uniref:SDR family oxidoreductase n=1 Tax=Microbacterium sp. ZXX196 TaxID=2609291 RepID=UPI0012B90D60|nr:SDR family oxidoreductase [Microbacterium sp. ZXX196]MTE23336.1 SDR family NAD(P)-dependent oxidoreductase [Microbacterium sp. ZXX196]